MIRKCFIKQHSFFCHKIDSFYTYNIVTKRSNLYTDRVCLECTEIIHGLVIWVKIKKKNSYKYISGNTYFTIVAIQIVWKSCKLGWGFSGDIHFKSFQKNPKKSSQKKTPKDSKKGRFQDIPVNSQLVAKIYLWIKNCGLNERAFIINILIKFKNHPLTLLGSVQFSQKQLKYFFLKKLKIVVGDHTRERWQNKSIETS